MVGLGRTADHRGPGATEQWLPLPPRVTRGSSLCRGPDVSADCIPARTRGREGCRGTGLPRTPVCSWPSPCPIAGGKALLRASAHNAGLQAASDGGSGASAGPVPQSSLRGRGGEAAALRTCRGLPETPIQERAWGPSLELSSSRLVLGLQAEEEDTPRAPSGGDQERAHGGGPAWSRGIWEPTRPGLTRAESWRLSLVCTGVRAPRRRCSNTACWLADRERLPALVCPHLAPSV